MQGEEQATGKSLGTDLEKQKPTLPIIRALEVASPADRPALLDVLQGDERQPGRLVPLPRAYDAVDYARSRGQAFAHRARLRLDHLSPSPARDVLAAMTEFVMSRSS